MSFSVTFPCVSCYTPGSVTHLTFRSIALKSLIEITVTRASKTKTPSALEVFGDIFLAKLASPRPVIVVFSIMMNHFRYWVFKGYHLWATSFNDIKAIFTVARLFISDEPLSNSYRCQKSRRIQTWYAIKRAYLFKWNTKSLMIFSHKTKCSNVN